MPSSPSSPTRRKPAPERRAEIVETASRIAIAEGLERVTAKSVAQALGVFPGLINYYFATADELVAAAFAHAVSAEREAVLRGVDGTPLEQMRVTLAAWMEPARDPIRLLWFDAWQASRRRAALAAEVARQMTIERDGMVAHIQAGVEAGEFHADRPGDAAMQLLALMDGLSVGAVARADLDYGAVREMAVGTLERILGLAAGSLRPA